MTECLPPHLGVFRGVQDKTDCYSRHIGLLYVQCPEVGFNY